MRSRWMMSLFAAFLCAAVSAGAYADPRQPRWGGVAHDSGGRDSGRDRGGNERWHGGDRDRHGWSPGWNGAWRFHDHDWDDWHHGHWAHDWYGGRFGWWWVVAGVWFFYPVPVYPFPDPYLYAPPVVIEPPPYGVTPSPAGYWYWCAPAQAYYPYVTTCPDAWEQVPATEPANPPPPPPP